MQVLEDKPDLSRWSLKYKAFGRDLEYSWLARNMQVNTSLQKLKAATILYATHFPTAEKIKTLQNYYNF